MPKYEVVLRNPPTVNSIHAKQIGPLYRVLVAPTQKTPGVQGNAAYFCDDNSSSVFIGPEIAKSLGFDATKNDDLTFYVRHFDKDPTKRYQVQVAIPRSFVTLVNNSKLHPHYLKIGGSLIRGRFDISGPVVTGPSVQRVLTHLKPSPFTCGPW